MLPLAMLAFVAAERLTYRADIQPLFERSCYGCHAAGVKMGSLDLETWEGLQRGGNNGTIVAPGKPGESRLYTMLLGHTAPAMPMDGKVLPRAQIDAVRLWIEQGADPGDALSPPRLPRLYALAATAETLVLGRANAIDWIDLKNPRTRTASAPSPARAVANSGEWTAAALANEVRLYQESSLTRTFAGAAQAVALSKNGRTLAIANTNSIELYDTTGRPLRQIKVPTVNALAFAGERLISADASGTLKIWNPATGEWLRTINASKEALNALAISPDAEKVAAAGADKRISLWRIATAELLKTRPAHDDQIFCLAWSHDGTRLASSSADKTLKVWDATKLTELRVYPDQPDWILGLAPQRGGAWVIGRFDGHWSILPAF